VLRRGFPAERYANAKAQYSEVMHRRQSHQKRLPFAQLLYTEYKDIDYD